MSSPLQLEADKQMLRVKARAARQAISAETRRRAAEAVADRGLDFLDLPVDGLAGYYPVRSEFDCMPLLRRLADAGWPLSLPVVSGAAPLLFHEWCIGDPVDAGAFGIPQPGSGRQISPSLIFVPLLAFDRRRYRLGYGGGHYDRTLAALRENRKVTAIGLAFDAQEENEVPVGPHDQPLDWVLTPSAAIGPQS